MRDAYRFLLLLLTASVLYGAGSVSVRAAEKPRPLVETICPLMEKEAAANGLPPVFFVRLIWRESAFRPNIVSHKGAQGIAQFMPGTAKERGLENPLDPTEAIPHSARLLADLKRDFGNVGLAAAAYNAGPERIRGWLEGRRRLPAETQAYVRFITGRPAEEWKQPDAPIPNEIAVTPTSLQDSCKKLAPTVVHALNAKAPARAAPGGWRPWGVQLAANFSQAKVAVMFDQLRTRHASLLASAQPMYVTERNLSRGRQAMVALRIGAESREDAQKLCLRLRSDGGTCTVEKN
jgi:hypothetical protein